MGVTFSQEKQPDGSILQRRYTDERLEGSTQFWQFPSGCKSSITFDADGNKVSEHHSFGLDLMLMRSFQDGKKTSETYIYRKRLVTRATYEKQRLHHPDMPAADMELADEAKAALAYEREERRERKLAASSHKPDVARARKLDAFCMEKIRGERVADAYSWIEHATNTLGEMNRAASRRLIAKLKELECPSVHAFEIDDVDENHQNTGHLIVELPLEPKQRSKTRAVLARIAERQGYEGYPDDGQRYEYSKLD